MSRSRQLIALCAGVLFPAMALGGDPYFVGLDVLPDAPFPYTESTGISRDGTVVLGWSDGDPPQVARWVNAGSPTGMGFLGRLVSVSDDGVAYAGGIGDWSYPDEAVLWTDPALGGDGLRLLGFLPGHEESSAWGMSADGSVVVGTSQKVGGGWGDVLAFRWTDPDAGGLGMVSLGTLGGNRSSASGVSADGTVIVGASWANADPDIFAFRWVLTDPDTGAGEMAALGDPDGRGFSVATAVTSDGSMVAGHFTNSTNNYETFLWTAGGGMQRLGFPPGMWRSAVSSMSDTGVIVGDTQDPNYEGYRFIWDEANGMRLLRDVLEGDYGLDLTGWDLNPSGKPIYISADGRSITGFGVNPAGEMQAWLAFLGDDCIADCTGNGEVDTRDFICFLSLWAAGDEAADCDGDGVVNTRDFICFLGAWAAGC